MAKKGSSKHQKELYQKYKNEDRWLSNKIKRIQRHIKKHPNDVAAQKVLDNVNFSYTRNRNNKNTPVAAPKINIRVKFPGKSIREQLANV